MTDITDSLVLCKIVLTAFVRNGIDCSGSATLPIAVTKEAVFSADADCMPANTVIPASSLAIDEQAVSAFVAEIANSVENTALVCIFDRQSRAIWHQAFQSGAPAPDDCKPAADVISAEPAKRPLGRGNYAYDFPLLCSNVELCLLTVVIYTIDPPSLTSVEYQISTMLSCIARQIDVDVTLSTSSFDTRKIADAVQAQAKSREPVTTNTTESLLQSVVNQCYEESGAECVAVVIRAQQSTTIACKESFAHQTISDLVVRLHGAIEKKRRVISAKITLPDSSDCRVVCAPILSKQQSIEGMALLITKQVDPSHTKTARLLANRIVKLRQDNPAPSNLLSRVELIATIDDTLNTQTTLPHSLIYFDSDRMHTINDAFGYSGGDRALARFRSILVDSAGANDAVAHLGSDRFALFLPGASGDTAVAKATQILQFLSQETIDDDSKSIKLSASAGVVDNSAAKKGAEDMLVLAEVASRGAQDRGGDQSALFQDIDSSIIQRRSDVDKIGFLQMALLEDRFVLHAQRIEAINAPAGQKFELLARLEGDGEPDSSPAQFLSAAERYQLMAALDRWVINSALTSIAGADNTLEVSLSTFCINVSAQSLQDEGFVDFIEARIAESGIPPDTLCFELTETSLVRHINKAQHFVHRLQRLGCLVALDDFGTGYSSFAYLKTLPVNFLKIDGSFVRDILESDLSKAIVHAVVSIADVIGAQTVAEHVENPMVRAWLKQAGVHYIQGFVVHKPEPLTAVLDSLDCPPGLFDDDTESIDLRAGASIEQSLVS